MSTISSFKANLIGGGARANQFRVELTFPSYVSLGVVAGQRAQFLVKAASLPAVAIEPITVPYRGRPVNFAGERIFSPWTVTVINEGSFGVRNALEQWSNGIQNFGATNGRLNPADYQVDLSVHQLDRNGAIIKSYKFHDAFPTEIGEIGLSFDQSAIEEFSCTFTYNYYTSNTGGEGDAFGVNVSVDTPIGSFPI